MRTLWISGVLGVAIALMIVPVARAQSNRPAAPRAAQVGGPDYTAFVKNGYKPVVTAVDKMTPSSMPFATEISPPIQEPNCAQAPANFNPVTASAPTLMKYGFPPRAKNENQASWLSKVSWMKHRVCVSYQTNGPAHGFNSTKSANAALFRTPQKINTTFWAGNVADETCGQGCDDGSYSYSEIDADWHIPCVSLIGNIAPVNSTAWLGIGGTQNYFELIQDGTESDQTGIATTKYDVWYEYVGIDGFINPVDVYLGPGNTQNKCGDHIYARVYGGNCYELGDIGDGNYFEECTGPDASSTSAEGIVERNGQDFGYGLANFGTVTFQGIGATENQLGYRAISNLQHDYYDMYWNSGWLAKTAPIQSDPTDWPYDQYEVVWYSACGGNLTCL